MKKKQMKKQIKALTRVILQHEEMINDLDDTIAFYATSINNLEILVKRLSEYQYIPPTTVSTPWKIFNGRTHG